MQIAHFNYPSSPGSLLIPEIKPQSMHCSSPRRRASKSWTFADSIGQAFISFGSILPRGWFLEWATCLSITGSHLGACLSKPAFGELERHLLAVDWNQASQKLLRFQAGRLGSLHKELCSTRTQPWLFRQAWGVPGTRPYLTRFNMELGAHPSSETGKEPAGFVKAGKCVETRVATSE